MGHAYKGAPSLSPAPPRPPPPRRSSPPLLLVSVPNSRCGPSFYPCFSSPPLHPLLPFVPLCPLGCFPLSDAQCLRVARCSGLFPFLPIPLASKEVERVLHCCPAGAQWAQLPQFDWQLDGTPGRGALDSSCLFRNLVPPLLSSWSGFPLGVCAGSQCRRFLFWVVEWTQRGCDMSKFLVRSVSARLVLPRLNGPALMSRLCSLLMPFRFLLAFLPVPSFPRRDSL
jgi:hypothetical protein